MNFLKSLKLFSTEQNNGSQVFDDAREGDSAREFRYTNTPPDGIFPMHNGGNVQFEAPKVPVIFILGKSDPSLCFLDIAMETTTSFFESF